MEARIVYPAHPVFQRELHGGQGNAAGRQQRRVAGPLCNIHRNDDQLRVATTQGVLLGWNVRQCDDELKGVACEFGGGDGIEDLL